MNTNKHNENKTKNTAKTYHKQIKTTTQKHIKKIENKKQH